MKSELGLAAAKMAELTTNCNFYMFYMINKLSKQTIVMISGAICKNVRETEAEESSLFCPHPALLFVFLDNMNLSVGLVGILSM